MLICSDSRQFGENRSKNRWKSLNNDVIIHIKNPEKIPKNPKMSWNIPHCE